MSSKKCCVPGCVNSSGSKDTLHKFPHPIKYKEMFNRWLYTVGGPILGLENETIFKYRRVCHIHFEEKFWCHSNRLSNIAVPTKNLPGLSPVKFVGNEIFLTRIRNSSEASTSQENVFVTTNPVSAGTRLLESAVQDVQMKESLENVSVTINPVSAGTRLLESAVQDVQMKESLENVSVTTNPVSAGTRLLESAVQDVQMKESLENVSVTTNTVSTGPRLLESAVQDVQMKESLETVVMTAHANTVAPNQSALKDAQKKDHPRIVSSYKVSAAVQIRKKLCKRVAITPAEQALYRKLVQVNIKLSKCRNKIKGQAAKIKAMKNLTSNPRFLETLDNLPSTAKILTLMQFRENKKKNKGQRFSFKEKLVALSIYKQSSKGYRFLRKIFILPSPQTLVKLLNMADIRPGINKNTFEQIKKATEKMRVEHKLCIVLFDEMSLKPNVAYNERKDRVCGFVTDGLDTRAEFADHVQVFMIRGLLKSYKQPVSYTFSQAATKGPELAKQLKAVITELQGAGLIVVATVCDQGNNNSQCIKILSQETRAALLRKGQEPRSHAIIINDQEIIPLYDPPHLMKCVRNNLITKDLIYKKDNVTKTAKWSHITCLHEENPGYKGIRLVPKLTDLHCVPNKIPRMKVKYATQLFSQTVASNMGYLADKGIIPTESKDTADILLFFDKLFDSMNGSFEKKKKIHSKPLLGPATPKSAHIPFWAEAKHFLNDMKFISARTNKVEYVPTLKNWVWTLEGIEDLIKSVQQKYAISSLWLRHLNQDPLENFFGSIRSHGCRNVNPTPEKFETAFTTLLVNSLSSVHAPGANCEVDNCIALHEAMITGSSEKVVNPDVIMPNITITPLEQKNDPRKIGGLQYVSGYFIKKAKQKVFKGCNQCNKDLIRETETEYIKYREYANKKWLYSPSDSLLCCVSSLQDISYAVITENFERNNLKELMKTMIFMFIEFDFVKCNIHKDDIINYLITVSCRFYIYNYCKDINKVLTNKRDCDDDEDVFKIKAKKYYTKCFKRKLTK